MADGELVAMWKKAIKDVSVDQMGEKVLWLIESTMLHDQWTDAVTEIDKQQSSPRHLEGKGGFVHEEYTGDARVKLGVTSTSHAKAGNGWFLLVEVDSGSGPRFHLIGVDSRGALLSSRQCKHLLSSDLWAIEPTWETVPNVSKDAIELVQSSSRERTAMDKRRLTKDMLALERIEDVLECQYRQRRRRLRREELTDRNELEGKLDGEFHQISHGLELAFEWLRLLVDSANEEASISADVGRRFSVVAYVAWKARPKDADLGWLDEYIRQLGAEGPDTDTAGGLH